MSCSANWAIEAIMQEQRDSNPRPSVLETDILAGWTMLLCVEPRGVEPRSRDFQSCAYTKSAKVPFVFLMQSYIPWLQPFCVTKKTSEKWEFSEDYRGFNWFLRSLFAQPEFFRFFLKNNFVYANKLRCVILILQSENQKSVLWLTDKKKVAIAVVGSYFVS